ncbi:hypothetical protein C0J45_17945, partial [Silurus meridionalis]
MEGKLPEDQMKSLLAPWRFSWQSSGFKNRLLTALELYEHFPLDIAVTGGTKSSNARLAFAVCGLLEEQEEEEEEEEEEEKESDEDEDSDEQEEDGDGEDDDDTKKKLFVRFREDFAENDPDSAPVLLHPLIPNVRILTIEGSSGSPQDRYDVLVVLTTELHQEDHMRFIMELYEKNKPLYLVKADKEIDIVREKLAGPCKTCAWERMRERISEFRKKHKAEFELTKNANHQGPFPLHQGIKLWEAEMIAGVLMKAIPELRKKAFSQFLVDLTHNLKVPLTERHRSGSLASSSLKNRKISQEDLGKISAVFQSQDLTDQPSKLLSIFSALEHFRLDVGVLGETGCGSSSLFNSLLGLKNGDKGASDVGVFETTKTPVTYSYLDYHNVLLWDLPGLGSVKDFKAASSGPMHHAPPIPPIPPCDVYILVSPLRFNLGYIQLVKHLLLQGKCCYLVLSKADLIEEKATKEVRRWNTEMLEKLGLKQDIYLVSAFHPETMDLPKMRKDFEDAIESHRRVALANYVSKLLEEDVFWKRPDPCK